MVRYIIKRLFIGVVTIWALITITFFLIRIMPGSPFEADNLSQSAIEQLESTYGLDEPMWKQYILYMENLMHGDLGISYKKNVSVNTLIARGFPYTLSIGLLSIAVSAFIGILMGIWMATSKRLAVKNTLLGIASGYAQIPDNKSFSNVNGAELLMTPSKAIVSADQEKQTCVYLDTDGNALITGKKICLHAEKNLIVGDPAEEDGQASRQMVLEAEELTVQVGGNGSQINLTDEARIIAAFVKMDASDRSPAANPSLEELRSSVTANDETNRKNINEDVSNELVEKFEEGRTSILKGIVKVAATVATVAVAVALTAATGGAAAVIIATVVLGAATAAYAVADVGEGIDNYKNAQSGDLSQGHNFMRDDVFGGNELLYELVRAGTEIAFGVVSGCAIGSAFNKLMTAEKFIHLAKEAKCLKAVMQIGGNVLDGIFDDLARTGEIT